MLKRVFSLLLAAVTLSVGFTALCTTSFAADSDVATITFDTENAVPFFYESGDVDVTFTTTDEYAFTGKSLKVTIDVPDNSVHEAKILIDAGKLKIANFNNCTIEAHVLFPTDSDPIWGPGTQSVSMIATDPSWSEIKTDPTLYGAWQTVTLTLDGTTNNKSLGFYLPIDVKNSGTVVCYIDDIRIIKDGVVLDSIDMDPNAAYPLPTDTATFATEATTTQTPVEDTDGEQVTTKKTTPILIEEEAGNPILLIVLGVSLVIIAVIAGVIYFFVWKSKNRYY